MKKTLIILFLCAFMATALSWAGEKAPQKVVDLANTKLSELGMDPVIIKAVKEENSKGKTLDKIKAMDEKWKGDAGIADKSITRTFVITCRIFGQPGIIGAKFPGHGNSGSHGTGTTGVMCRSGFF